MPNRIETFLDQIHENIGEKVAQSNPFPNYDKDRAKEIREGFDEGNIDEDEWMRWLGSWF